MRMDFDIDDKQFKQALKRVEKEGISVAEQAMNDAVDELIRISSEITPFEYGTLQKSHTREVNRTFNGMTAKVTYSVHEGNFNYALWIHEGIYKHGEGTMQKGTSTGWSGKTYFAGRKFLERPVKGEQKAMLQHIADEIRRKVGD